MGQELSYRRTILLAHLLRYNCEDIRKDSATSKEAKVVYASLNTALNTFLGYQKKNTHPKTWKLVYEDFDKDGLHNLSFHLDTLLNEEPDTDNNV